MSEGTPSELPLQGELSQEELEKKKKIQKLQHCLSTIDKFSGKRFPHDISVWLEQVGEKDLKIDSFKIALYDVIEIFKHSYDEGKYHDGVYMHYSQLFIVYAQDLNIPLENAEGFNILAKELGKLRALASELNGHHEMASILYKYAGENKKAEGEGSKQNEHPDFRDEELLEKANKIYKPALEQFFKIAEEHNPFKSQEERDAALEKLKADIQDKINTIS